MHLNVLTFVLIYLAAMVLVVPLAKRLGLGLVLGYLLAGLALGPYGLNFAGNNSSVGLLAELGVVLMLFTIGLELDAKRLWAMRHSVFTFGALQVLVCGAGMAIASYGLGLGATASIIVGITLALSSTAVAVQLMNDRNLLSAPVGQSVFGVLLFQDMVAIPLLIAVGVLAPSPNATPFNGLKALAAVLVLLLIGKFVLGKLLRWVAQQGSRELFVAAALLVVIAVMEGMTYVGISSGLGAFIAGMMLASSEFKHELEADLDPFKGLFLGLFFMTIGSSLDVALLFNNAVQILALLLAFLFFKMILLGLLAYSQGVAKRERLSYATLLGQGSEFAFVVSGLALAGGLLSAQQGASFNLLIGLSIAVSPLLMKLTDYLQFKWYSQKKSDPIMDTQMDHNPVVIAGFGRFGQIVGRTLRLKGIGTTVLDHDSAHIENMRQFGFKVYFGDASRLDLLEVAGVHQAKILVVAVDDPETSLKIVDLAQKHFPNVTLVVRARNVAHYFKLREKGIIHIERELFEGSLNTAKTVVGQLGFSAQEASALLDQFRTINFSLMQKFEKVRAEVDDKNFASEVRKVRAELERQLDSEKPKLVTNSASNPSSNPS